MWLSDLDVKLEVWVGPRPGAGSACHWLSEGSTSRSGFSTRTGSWHPNLDCQIGHQPAQLWQQLEGRLAPWPSDSENLWYPRFSGLLSDHIIKESRPAGPSQTWESSSSLGLQVGSWLRYYSGYNTSAVKVYQIHLDSTRQNHAFPLAAAAAAAIVWHKRLRWGFPAGCRCSSSDCLQLHW
jgi:hypothetical protein